MSNFLFLGTHVSQAKRGVFIDPLVLPVSCNVMLSSYRLKARG